MLRALQQAARPERLRPAGDRSILNGWFCGYMKGELTDYAIVILKEDVRSGSADCAPVFKEITEKMHDMGK